MLLFTHCKYTRINIKQTYQKTEQTHCNIFYAHDLFISQAANGKIYCRNNSTALLLDYWLLPYMRQ